MGLTCKLTFVMSSCTDAATAAGADLSKSSRTPTCAGRLPCLSAADLSLFLNKPNGIGELVVLATGKQCRHVICNASPCTVTSASLIFSSILWGGTNILRLGFQYCPSLSSL